MKTIYKYSLEASACTIDLPIGSKVVCVYVENSFPTLWVEQNTALPTDEFRFYVVGDNCPVPEDGVHIGTCFIGANVWHVYQKL